MGECGVRVGGEEGEGGVPGGGSGEEREFGAEELGDVGEWLVGVEEKG